MESKFYFLCRKEFTDAIHVKIVVEMLNSCSRRRSRWLGSVVQTRVPTRRIKITMIICSRSGDIKTSNVPLLSNVIALSIPSSQKVKQHHIAQHNTVYHPMCCSRCALEAEISRPPVGRRWCNFLFCPCGVEKSNQLYTQHAPGSMSMYLGLSSEPR